MAVEARIRELDARHQSLDRAIHEEIKRPASDEQVLKELKRQKLKLKEEIEGLKAKGH